MVLQVYDSKNNILTHICDTHGEQIGAIFILFIFAFPATCYIFHNSSCILNNGVRNDIWVYFIRTTAN
jgi:hypothetical protein